MTDISVLLQNIMRNERVDENTAFLILLNKGGSNEQSVSIRNESISTNTESDDFWQYP